MQDCEVTGLPPVQPGGADETTALIWVPDDEHELQLEYEKEVQVGI